MSKLESSLVHAEIRSPTNKIVSDSLFSLGLDKSDDTELSSNHFCATSDLAASMADFSTAALRHGYMPSAPSLTPSVPPSLQNRTPRVRTGTPQMWIYPRQQVFDQNTWAMLTCSSRQIDLEHWNWRLLYKVIGLFSWSIYTPTKVKCLAIHCGQS